MTERDHTTKQMAASKSILRGCKQFKHSDRATRGVPDETLTWLGDTWWLENKYRRKGEQWSDLIEEDQLMSCMELATTSDGKCWIIEYREAPKCVVFWSPRLVACEMFPERYGVDPRGPHPSEILDLDEAIEEHDVYDLLRSRGALGFTGWRYDAIGRVIYDATRSKQRRKDDKR